MYFTEGRHRKYERLMKEKPGFDRGTPKEEPEHLHKDGQRETDTRRRSKKKNKE